MNSFVNGSFLNGGLFNNIRFYSDNGVTALGIGGPVGWSMQLVGNEIVPPEASTWVGIGSLVLLAGFYEWHRRVLKARQKTVITESKNKRR